MKPRELTAALFAVVGATCVVAFALVYLVSPELPLGPVLSAPRLPAPPVVYGPPEPPPANDAPPTAVVVDREEDRDRWVPDTPAVPPTPEKKKASKKDAKSEGAHQDPKVVALPTKKISPARKKKRVLTAPIASPVTTREADPVVAAMPPLMMEAPELASEEEASPAVTPRNDPAVVALVAPTEVAATDAVPGKPDSEATAADAMVVVDAPVVPEARQGAAIAGEPELAGGRDVAEAIATSALDLAEEDEGALNSLSAADIEADRWLTENDGTSGYPGAADAGTLWTDAAPGATNVEVLALGASELTPEFALHLPEEVDTVPSVAAIEPNDYGPMRERLLELEAKAEALPEVKPFRFAPPVEAPVVAEKTAAASVADEEPALVAETIVEEPKTAEELQAEWAREEKPEPELVAPKPKIREALASETETREEKAEQEALESAVRRQVSKDVAALNAIEASPKLVAERAPSARREAMATQAVGVVSTSTRSNRPVLDARQEFAAIASGTVGPKVSGPSAALPSAPAVMAEAEPELETRARRQTIFGSLRFGKRVEEWLETQRGHVELYLQPENTRDPSDTIYVEYHFPGPDFAVERGGLVGRYRLVAGIFSPKSAVAVAQIPYAKLLSEDNYKERVRFYLDDATFERALAGTASGLAKAVSLHLTLYSAGTSNYQGKGADGEGSFRQPTPISGATARILFATDIAPVRSDAEGNARFSRVPPGDLLVEVTAPGFMKTYAEVPAADGPTYQPIYLVAKDKVEAITHYFTRRPQQNGHAVVMGRTFDPKLRRPEAGQKVRLQNRKGPALYFGALPDPSLQATTKNGLFGYFNVAPSFRSLAREGRDAIPFLMHLRPNTGTYVELGRGGAKSLVARLYDPFAKKPVVGTVRLVGSDTVKVETNEKGVFRIDGIEFPPGIVTLEVDAEGYPITWLNVSWSTRDPERMRTLFLVEDDVVSTAVREFTKLTPKTDRGSIVGGAESEFFKKTQGCLTVTLESLEQGVAKKSQGPYPLLPSQSGPLCVSAPSPAFSFHDLPAGEWNLRWTNAEGQTLRSRLVRVGQNRVTVVVN